MHCRKPMLCAKAEQGQVTDRRAALTLLGGIAALLQAKPSNAAFGEGANIFGKVGNTTGLIPYVGKGFKVNLPSKWTPSAERDVPNVVLRYEDTGDNLNSVVIYKADKKLSSNVADPQSFLKENAYLFGQNVWQGATISEGGFKKNAVSATSLIDSYVDNKDGKPYYKMEVLSRTADGTEGGKHNLISAAVSQGDLYVCKVTIGDKRWVRGANKFGKSIFDTFTVV
ncbi:hypothetical protein WJX73_000084 [Symbiochloris irregularis]|uniref:PsbP C-terminal domain-containing protein n=1 Tax=Symbiochloris irregularis TaxID=706552 RepID=A0AAW1PF66_9CHLO